MICKNCGCSNVPSAKFCSVCGENMFDSKAEPSQSGGYNIAKDYDDGFSQDYHAYNARQERPGNYRQNPNGGYNQNYGNQGYRQGYNQGYNQGYGNQGYHQGYPQGYGNQGYNQGYPQGYGQPGYYGGYGYDQRAVSRPQRSTGALVIFMISGVLALLCLLMTALPSIKFEVAEGGVMGYWKENKVTELTKQLYKGEKPVEYEGVYVFAVRNMDNDIKDKDTKYTTQNYEERKTSDSVKKSDYTTRGFLALAMFLIPSIFLLIAAILSFTRNSSAGGLMLTGSILYTSVAGYWISFLDNSAKLGTLYFSGAKKNTGMYEFTPSKYGITTTAVPTLMIILGIAGIVIGSIQIAKRNRV